MTNTQQSLKSVTVSIVSHNQQDLILPLIEQLQRLCSAQIAKVVVTVNTPERDLISLRTWSLPIEMRINSNPKGFGANHNAAYCNCSTPWFLVLNPDVRLEADVLTPLTAGAQDHVGLLAPRVREPGKVLPEPHRALLTPMEILRRRRMDYQAPTHPSWVAGLFMLFRSEAFELIGGFDDRFFMYGEDFDICARMQLNGWTLQVREDLEVLHEAQRASHRSRKHLYWHIKSLLSVWLSSAFWRYRAMQH